MPSSVGHLTNECCPSYGPNYLGWSFCFVFFLFCFAFDLGHGENFTADTKGSETLCIKLKAFFER